jgi:multidrug efflux pump subunit AcrA (membrane-fusion protein)
MKILSRNSLILAIALGLFGGLSWKLYPNIVEMFAGGGGGKGSKHRIGKVKRGDLVQRVTVSGEIVPARRTNFVAPYSGYVQKMYVTVGQRVNKGDPVLSITSSLAVPEAVYPIRAPFAGTVVSISKKEGEYVTEKDTKDVIVRIDDLDTYFVMSKAPETDAARIKKNMEVEVKVNAIQKESLKGVVRNIELAAEEAEGWKAQQSTFKVMVEIIKPPADVRSGQSAVIDIVTKKFDDVLYLEHEFINKDGDQHFVIDARGRRRDITIGNQSDLAAEVTSGLKEGDKVEQVDFLKLLESGGQ